MFVWQTWSVTTDTTIMLIVLTCIINITTHLKIPEYAGSVSITRFLRRAPAHYGTGKKSAHRLLLIWRKRNGKEQELYSEKRARGNGKTAVPHLQDTRRRKLLRLTSDSPRREVGNIAPSCTPPAADLSRGISASHLFHPSVPLNLDQRNMALVLEEVTRKRKREGETERKREPWSTLRHYLRHRVYSTREHLQRGIWPGNPSTRAYTPSGCASYV